MGRINPAQLMTNLDLKERVQQAISNSQILEKLQPYSPTVVTTIILDLHTTNSDIDILCQHHNDENFSEAFRCSFEHLNNFHLTNTKEYILGSFIKDGFQFEIYSSTQPVNQQLGFRHYKIMERLKRLGGEGFCEQIRSLKRTGVKTESAMCRLLNIPGDPYQEILTLETLSDCELTQMLNR